MIPKFRAWDKFEKEMLDVHGINYDAEGVWTKEVFDEEDTGDFIHFSDIEPMQSTGIKDKNDNEIFEGDILKWHGIMGHGWFEDVQDEIVYDKHELRFKFKNRNEDIKNIVNIGVIVGNIYEHPHLLEED